MTNANTQISRKTIRPDVAARHETETAIGAVFATFDELPVDAAFAYHAREVWADRARLDAAHAAMVAQIDSVFASA